MYICEYCGGELAPYGQQAVCTVCGRIVDPETFRMMQQMQAPPVEPAQPKQTGQVSEDTKKRIIRFGVIAIMAGFLIGPPAMIVAGIVGAGILLKKNNTVNPAQQGTVTPITRDPYLAQQSVRQGFKGEPLNTPEDYIYAFRMLPLTTMPLRNEAGEALEQLDALARKRQAIYAILSPGHPYLATCEDAVSYILQNMKQILYRLRYCDQNDLSMQEAHRSFLRTLLDENASVLRDFENLIIELTQSEAGMPATEPCLDVLADSLRAMRQTAAPNTMDDLQGWQRNQQMLQ